MYSGSAPKESLQKCVSPRSWSLTTMLNRPFWTRRRKLAVRAQPLRYLLAFLRGTPEEQPVGDDEVTVDRDLERAAADERRPGRGPTALRRSRGAPNSILRTTKSPASAAASCPNGALFPHDAVHAMNHYSK